jgi:dTDP-4-amino-4,6-dideoxygalactose transaminase
MSKQYHHDRVGINSRLDGIQAAILRVKLRHLPDYIKARQSAAARYDAMLEGLPMIERPKRDSRSSHVFHQYTLKVPAVWRNELQQHLKEMGIPTGIYYPIPGHAQKAFQSFEYAPKDHPVSTNLASTVLSLPMHTELTENQQSHIIDSIRIFVDKQKEK